MRALSVLAVVALLAPPAAADVFVLQNGQEVDGFLVGRTPKKEVVIQMTTGQRRLHESTVKEVRPSADPAADFPKYLAALGKKDADAAAALGAWAKERGLPDRAREAFERALSLRPDLVAAHEGLGHVRAGAEWVTAAEAERRRKEEALRQETASKYEKAMGALPEVALAPHWMCADFLGDGKAPDRVKDLEAAYAEAERILGSGPWRGRALVVACSGQEQYQKWLDVDVAGLPGVNKGYLEFFKGATGMKFTYPPILGRSDLPDRGAMHAANVHSAGHLLVNNWKGHNRDQPFWIEEGFGGWTESLVLKSNSSYCWERSKQGYGSSFRDVKRWEVDDPDWKNLVKEAAGRNEFLPLDQLDSLPKGEYTRREVGQSFSLVAFLLREKGLERWRAYLEQVKGGEKSSVAVRKSYGQSFEDMEPEWKRFVQSGW